MRKSIAILISFFSLALGAQQVSLVERVIDVQTAEKNPATARSILLNQANEKASEELIKEIIGEAKFTRNRALIGTKIMKKSASYLPFLKAGELKPAGEGYQMSVTVRANLDDLQRLLLENGLFYDTDSTPSVLPLVKWTDRVNGKSFAWWMGADPNKTFLIKESRFLETALGEAFLKNGFYVVKPQSLRYVDLLSPEDRGENLSPEKASNWAQSWNAQILLQGNVQFSKGDRSDTVSGDIRLSAVQALNGRVIAEVARQFETEPGAFEAVTDRKIKEVVSAMSTDLSAQMLEAWKQGSINSQLYRLRIAGRLSLPAQEGFKEALRNKVREIKSVRERLIESNQLTYEIESSMSPQDVAKKFGELDVQGVKLVVDQANEKDLVLKIKR